jgi:hypothetical protein
MDAQDEPDISSPPEAIHTDPVPTLITATGLAVDGEHGPLFSDVDLALTPGFHAIQLSGGPGQKALLLTLAGRFKPTRGTVQVAGDTQPRVIRRHCSIAAFAGIDELAESVTVQTVLAEQRRWLAPWYSWVSIRAGRDKLAEVFGEISPPSAKTRIVELSELELFLLRITLALLPDRPILVVGDLEQVRDNSWRAIAVDRLGAIAMQRTVVVGVTNPLGAGAPDHDLHDHRILNGRG